MVGVVLSERVLEEGEEEEPWASMAALEGATTEARARLSTRQSSKCWHTH